MILLLVEDNALVALTLEDALNAAGHQVLGPAATADEALDLAADTTPDLALVDIRLRGDQSGIALARRLRADWGTPSLFVSGQAMAARANKDAALGLISKPCAPETVLQGVEAADRLLKGEGPDAPEGVEFFQPNPP